MITNIEYGDLLWEKDDTDDFVWFVIGKTVTTTTDYTTMQKEQMEQVLLLDVANFIFGPIDLNDIVMFDSETIVNYFVRKKSNTKINILYIRTYGNLRYYT